MLERKWKRQVPVYLFTGFLESGKTTFMNESMAEPEFTAGERNLCILCEEGEVEPDFTDNTERGYENFVEKFRKLGATIIRIDD